MRNYIIKKLLIGVLIILGVTIGTFMLLFLSADPVATLLPAEATEADIEEFRQLMGLNDPIYQQLGRYIWQVLRFDFGTSYVNNQPVIGLIMERIPATLELSIAAVLFYVCLSIPMGVIAAIKRFTLVDNLITLLAVMGMAMPLYWTGIMLIIVFGVELQLLPISGRGDLLHLILPTITLGSALLPLGTRLTRSAMIDVLGQDYIRSAKAKGVSQIGIYFKHALRNAILPVLTAVFIQTAYLLSGTVVTETVFAWPGLGRLAAASIMAGDYPMVRALVIIFSIMVVSLNLIGDILISIIDPRIRLK